jgi:fructokinase
MRFALGIDLGGTKIEAQLLGPEGDVVWRDRRPTPQGSYAGTLAAIAAQVADARTALAGIAPVSQISAGFSIGAGTPGTAGAGGLMKNCNSTCLNGRPLGADLAALLGQPVALANDANCLALSEATDGAGAGANVVFGVILGTGVGAGIAVHGRVLQGANGIAGEWGHNPLPWAREDERPGPRCYCGKRGCLETWLSGPGFARDHLARLASASVAVEGAAPTALEISRAAEAGDPLARESLERYADRMARGLATIIDVLDPDAIVLGGGMSNLGGLYPLVRDRLSSWVFSDYVDVPVVPAAHGDSSGVRGAAWLWGGPASFAD